jgi:hypothetical protein
LRSFILGAGIWFSIAAAHAATPDELYQTWQQNSRMQPDIAEKAAQDYLRAAPDGPHAQGLQVWLDAYHKTLASLLSRAPQSLWKSAPSKPPQPAKQAAAQPQQASQSVVQHPAQPPRPAPVQTQPSSQPVAQHPAQAPSPPIPPPPVKPPPPTARLASAAPPEKPAPSQPAARDEAPPKVAPPPSPTEKPQGRSLVETLAFIAGKIESEGRISFVARFHDAVEHRDIVQSLTYTASNVTMDPNRCRVSFHWHVDQDGKKTTDEDRVVELRLAKDVTVETIDQALTDLNAGPRPLTASARPSLFAVHIARWDKPAGDNLYFHGKEMAAQVGEAGRHALDLCEDKAKPRARRR